MTWYFTSSDKVQIHCEIVEHFRSFLPITLWFWRYAYPWFLFHVQVSRFPFRIRICRVALNLYIAEPIYLPLFYLYLAFLVLRGFYIYDLIAVATHPSVLLEACIHMHFAFNFFSFTGCSVLYEDPWYPRHNSTGNSSDPMWHLHAWCAPIE